MVSKNSEFCCYTENKFNMTTKQNRTSNGWNVSLWIAQILLAALFLMVGYIKSFTPIPELVKIIPFAGEMPGLVRFIGISELAGGLGLLLPSVLRIWPRLTIVAAAALVVVMALAVAFHAMRGESIAISSMVLIIAAYIIWGRIYKAPIKPRTFSKQSIVNS